jgi:hypothetical protein
VGEGLSPSEVGKELGEHAKRARGHGEHERRELIAIAEAVLLSIVTVVAAWSGYSAAKWSTESSLDLAKASATRTKANRAITSSFVLRSQDASDFNAWFAAYLSGKRDDQKVAEKRFRPQYDVAFRAWLETHPFTNPDAPKGPQYMPQYRPTGAALGRMLDARADHLYAQGRHAAVTSDKYVRVTVILASVLFIAGISTHFRMRGVRVGLICVGAGLLILAAVQILRLPGPPS